MHYQLRITASVISVLFKNNILTNSKETNLMLEMCIQRDQVNMNKYVSNFYVFPICLTCFCYCSIIEEILLTSYPLGAGNDHTGQTELKALVMQEDKY